MLMKWIASITALVGTLGLGALFLVPGMAGILNAVLAFLTPIAEGLGKLVAWLMEKFFDGMKNALDTLTAIFFVLVLVAGTYGYTELYGAKRRAAEHEIVLMKKQIDNMKVTINGLRAKCGDRCRGR